jgi:threonine dehydrogenase-like Zn-dependent dehydrogenase
VFPENKDISFNNRDLFLKEASLNSSVSYKTKYFNSAIEVLRNNPNFEKIITHEFDLINFKK